MQRQPVTPEWEKGHKVNKRHTPKMATELFLPTIESKYNQPETSVLTRMPFVYMYMYIETIIMTCIEFELNL